MKTVIAPHKKALRAHLVDVLCHGGSISEYDVYSITWSTPDAPDEVLWADLMPNEDDIAAAMGAARE